MQHDDVATTCSESVISSLVRGTLEGLSITAARELRIDHPVLDLSGLDAAATRCVIEALSPGSHLVDAVT